MSCWAKGLVQPSIAGAQKLSQATPPSPGPVFPGPPTSLHCPGQRHSCHRAPVVPSLGRGAARHGQMRGLGQQTESSSSSPGSGAPFHLGGHPSHTGAPSAQPCRASAGPPGRRATALLTQVTTSSQRQSRPSSAQGPRRGAEGAGQGGSQTTVVTDFLYKHPEGSFLTHLLRMSHEGGRVELPGVELGSGLHLVGRLRRLRPARLSRRLQKLSRRQQAGASASPVGARIFTVTDTKADQMGSCGDEGLSPTGRWAAGATPRVGVPAGMEAAPGLVASLWGTGRWWFSWVRP